MEREEIIRVIKMRQLSNLRLAQKARVSHDEDERKDESYYLERASEDIKILDIIGEIH